MSHVMVDIETLGTAPGSVILSIGACVFDSEGTTHEFEAVIDPRDAVKYGLTIDPDTVCWWAGQSEEARRAVFLPKDDPKLFPLSEALWRFSEWFRSAWVNGQQVWCHGATFDVPLLDAAYRACGLAAPWGYNQARCTRTLYELADVWPDRTRGVHHNALNDAKVQAQAAIEAHRQLGLLHQLGVREPC